MTSPNAILTGVNMTTAIIAMDANAARFNVLLLNGLSLLQQILKIQKI